MSTRAGSVPNATVARLPLYLRVLADLQAAGAETVSSEGLAQAAGVNPAQVRKDLSFVGSPGTRGVGYPVRELLDRLSSVLGLDRPWRVLLVGAGNLGRALASYGGFAARGFEVVAVVDADPARAGGEIAGLPIESVERLAAIVAEQEVDIAVVAVPAGAAQEVADRLVAAGVRSILNFAPAHLEVPDGVRVRKVDLSTELQILAYYGARRR